jgi:hypothetical protein
MPLYVNDGKKPIDSEGLSQAQHDALDHTGLTGVNNFTSALHGSTSHVGITGVGKIVQQVRARTTASFIGLPGTPAPDNTIPQQSEGLQILQATITPTSTSNILVFEFRSYGSGPGGTFLVAALYRDAIAGAIAASYAGESAGAFNNMDCCIVLSHFMNAPSTSSQTYKIRVGASGNLASPTFGGVAATTFIITEISP